jgi:hypothetical protein
MGGFIITNNFIDLPKRRLKKRTLIYVLAGNIHIQNTVYLKR